MAVLTQEAARFVATASQAPAQRKRTEVLELGKPSVSTKDQLVFGGILYDFI